MSSHHIVRDQQEPALIVHQLETFVLENLHGLLEWSPTVLCCESAIDRYILLGHKLDVAFVAKLEATNWQERLADQFPVKIYEFENDDFLGSALMHLQKENHRAVNIITEERFVNSLLIDAWNWVEVLDIVIFTEIRKYLLIRNPEFKKWLPANTELTVQFLALSSKWSMSGFEKQGSQLPGVHHLIKRQEGEGVIHCHQPPFLIVETL